MKPLRIESDASEYATGAVLSMLQDDGKWHPCTYLSKGFNEMERNYDVHDKCYESTFQHSIFDLI